MPCNNGSNNYSIFNMEYDISMYNTFNTTYLLLNNTNNSNNNNNNGLPIAFALQYNNSSSNNGFGLGIV